MNANKDWKGNRSSKYVLLGASNHTEKPRAVHDFYATDPTAVLRLAAVKPLPHIIYECACGEGHISKALISLNHQVFSTDLINRGYGIGGVDFLKVQSLPTGCTCILTNPPYKYTNEFIEHALELLPVGGEVIFLLNINILAGKERYRRFYQYQLLAECWLFTGRIQCAKNGNFDIAASSAVNYAWFVFRKGFHGTTALHWLP